MLRELLHRFRWARRFAEIIRLFLYPSYRRRWKAIREDFRHYQNDWRHFEVDRPVTRGSAWIVSSMSGVWYYKLDGIVGLAARFLGFNPAVLSFDFDSWRDRYNRLWKFPSSEDFRRYLPAMPGPAPEIVRFFEAAFDLTRLMHLSFQNVNIGRIALSNLLYRHKFEKLDFSSPVMLAELKRELQNVQRNVLAAEKWVAEARPELIIVLERGLSPAAEVFCVCAAKKVPIIQYLNSQHQGAFSFKRFSMVNRHSHPFSVDSSTWEEIKAMPWGPQYEAELLREFEEDYRSGNWFRRKFLHEGKKFLSPEEVRARLRLDPAKKTAVIFSHVLWDATFFYGEGLFQDYETWLVETVKAAAKNPSVNWVVKIHPDLAWKIKHENFTGELRDLSVLRNALRDASDRVTIVTPETDIDTFSFFAITDYCLTVRGTIGMEMACRGKPVLTAGTGRYSGHGFTIDSASQKEFLERVARIQDIPPLSAERKELACRFAYALFKLRPWVMTSFRDERMPMQSVGHPLESNIQTAAPIGKLSELFALPDLKELADWMSSSHVDYLRKR
jgi:hypothetical protein